jgi:hypothetical protein
MKLAIKILKTTILLLIMAVVILFSSSILLQDKVAEIILSSLNKNITTKIDIGSFSFSLLKKFPRASLSLNNVIVLSSPGIDKASFKDINTDTLLVAETVLVEFKITDLIKQVYDIDRIAIRKGTISLFSDSTGRVNYSITKDGTGSDKTDLTINLKRIILSELKFSYTNLAIELNINGDIQKGRLSSRISRDIITINAKSELLVKNLQQNSIKITNPFYAAMEVKMEDSDEGILLKKGDLSVEGLQFGITGSVSSDDDLDLTFSGKNIDLSKIIKYLPSGDKSMLNNYEVAGNLQLNTKITGRLSKTINPHIELYGILSNGEIMDTKKSIAVKNVSFTGYYSNGNKNNSKTAVASLKDIKALIGSADYYGNITITNFTKPITEIDFKGRIFPGELKEFFGIENISASSGFCDLDLKLKTDFWPKDSIDIKDIVKLKPEILSKFNDFSIVLKNNKLAVENVNGEITFLQNLSAKNLHFLYKGQTVVVDGKFINLPEWIAGERVTLNAEADIYFDKLNLDTFFTDSSPQTRKEVVEAAIEMPDDLNFNLNLKIDSLIYLKLPSSDLSANLKYQKGLLTFKSLKMKSLGGVISGDGFVAQNKDKSYMAKGDFTVSEINIKKAFYTFKNFGQSFIKSENLDGNLTGSLTLLTPLDSLFNPVLKSLVAEGNYLISNGELTDFEPVKELSSFIELSELENIRFEKLKNEFFIRNNFIYIPQMEVNSSAADLSVNGKHSFDNIYEYHIKIRLSEILSKKRKKNFNNNTEFGVIEDDGLGRTSLLLKVESKGDDIKVGYDVKAAGDKVKASLKSERKTLRTILNEEYGFYKSDTSIMQKQQEKKHKFRITWDENDTIGKESDAVTQKKENALKNLFKKK